MTFDECIRAGGVVLFPADTVYGLAVDPGNEAAIERMYALKGRSREKKSALMYFLVDDVPDLPERCDEASARSDHGGAPGRARHSGP